MASSVEETASDRERRRANRRERKARRSERHAEETASDRERRRSRRRERRAKRHAERDGVSPVKIDTTGTSTSLLDNPEPERVHRPPAPPPQKDAVPVYHIVEDVKGSPRSTDSYSPPTTGGSAPVKTLYDHLDRYDADDLHNLPQHGYDDRHKRKSLGHPEHRESNGRHDHEHHRHHNEPPNRHHHDAKRRSHRYNTSRHSYPDQYKTNKSYEEYEEYEEHKPRRWSWKRISLIVAIPVILIIVIALAAATAVAKKHAFKYTPSYAKVTNSSAFTNGGAANDANNTDDGRGAGTDRYVYYTGPSSMFPPKDEWVSFANMWQANRNVIRNSCKNLGYGKDDTDEEITEIYNAIQSRASASLVDHRFILAVILQESHGCVRIPSSHNGVKNPGLMQSHDGASYSSWHPAQSILQMVQDGTQGTKSGPGLVQHLNTNGDAYSAARLYNSGTIAGDGNLSDGNGATACYVSDIANRLTGWVWAKSTCPSSSS